MQEEAGLGQPRIVQFRQGLEPSKKGCHESEEAGKEEVDAGAVNFFENLLGGESRGHSAPVEGQRAEGENDNERCEREYFILARGFRKLRHHEQEGNEDQRHGEHGARRDKEHLVEVRRRLRHGVDFLDRIYRIYRMKRWEGQPLPAMGYLSRMRLSAD